MKHAAINLVYQNNIGGDWMSGRVQWELQTLTQLYSINALQKVALEYAGIFKLQQ